MVFYPELLKKLVENFKKMPGIGPKSAQRLAFYIIESPEAEVSELSRLILEVKKQIKRCKICNNFATEDLCPICADNKRDKSLLSVVADPKEVIAIERSGEYKGTYHVLGGLISPLDGISPENLNIKPLLERLKGGEVKEVILAISPTTEGETTVFYLTRLLKPLGITTTRIAYGLPMGADMDYADEVTILKALEGRREV